MIIYEESRGVVMTADKKCIIRGHSKYKMILCEITEKSRYKVKFYRRIYR